PDADLSFCSSALTGSACPAHGRDITSQPHEISTAKPNITPLIYEGRRQDCTMTSSSGRIRSKALLIITRRNQKRESGFPGWNLRIRSNGLDSLRGPNQGSLF